MGRSRGAENLWLRNRTLGSHLTSATYRRSDLEPQFPPLLTRILGLLCLSHGAFERIKTNSPEGSMEGKNSARGIAEVIITDVSPSLSKSNTDQQSS